MDRREFFRRSALIAAGVVAADQLELLERLTWKRRLFAWGPPRLWGDGIHDDTAAVQWRIDHGVPIYGGDFLLRNSLHMRSDGIVSGVRITSKSDRAIIGHAGPRDSWSFANSQIIGSGTSGSVGFTIVDGPLPKIDGFYFSPHVLKTTSAPINSRASPTSTR